MWMAIRYTYVKYTDSSFIIYKLCDICIHYLFQPSHSNVEEARQATHHHTHIFYSRFCVNDNTVHSTHRISRVIFTFTCMYVCAFVYLLALLSLTWTLPSLHLDHKYLLMMMMMANCIKNSSVYISSISELNMQSVYDQLHEYHLYPVQINVNWIWVIVNCSFQKLSIILGIN